MSKSSFYEILDWEAEDTEQDTLEFELKIKCTWNKDENKDSSARVDDIYKNNNGMCLQLYNTEFNFITFTVTV